ncbi:11270_t:CDS:1, partial [Gigaspora rosea]
QAPYNNQIIWNSVIHVNSATSWCTSRHFSALQQFAIRILSILT